jgi:hypothetical protein
MMRRWRVARKGELVFWCLLGLPVLSSIPAAAAYFTTSSLLFVESPGVTNNGSVGALLLILIFGSIPIVLAGLAMGFVPGAICAWLVVTLGRRRRGMTFIEPVLVGLLVPAAIGFAAQPLTPVDTWHQPAQSWAVPAAFCTGGLVAVLLMLVIASFRPIFATARPGPEALAEAAR